MSAVLGLGTVQFGMPYGIANGGMEPTTEVVTEVLRAAGRAGFKLIDTAASYGSSEARLGEHDLTDFKIVTKTPRFAGLSKSEARDAVDTCVRDSLDRLCIDKLDGLLVHEANDLLSKEGDAIFEQLQIVRERGLVTRIGVSVYEAKQIDAILSRYHVDIMQLPVNVFDQRLVRGGQIAALAKQGVEIHARSVYLQGLLLLGNDALTLAPQEHRQTLARWQTEATGQGFTLQEAALTYVRDLLGVGVVLVGAMSPRQVLQTAAAFRRTGTFDAAALATSDVSLIDPRYWSGG